MQIFSGKRYILDLEQYQWYIKWYLTIKKHISINSTKRYDLWSDCTFTICFAFYHNHKIEKCQQAVKPTNEVARIPMDHIYILHMIIHMTATNLAINIYDWTAATNHTEQWCHLECVLSGLSCLTPSLQRELYLSSDFLESYILPQIWAILKLAISVNTFAITAICTVIYQMKIYSDVK